jgi:hypothetical protein
MKEMTKKLKDNFWFWVIMGFIVGIILGWIATAIIDHLRGSGWGAVNVIFTPGRQSIENILSALSPTFSLFSAMSVTISFFILGKAFDKTAENNLLKKARGFVIIAFVLLIAGFFVNLYFLILSNSTGDTISLETVYYIIRVLIIGLVFVFMTLISIYKAFRNKLLPLPSSR